MEKFTCSSGSVYGLALGFGVLEALEGASIDAIPAEAIQRLQAEASTSDEIDPGRFMALLSGEEMKQFLVDNFAQNVRLVARCLRKADGKSVGSSFDERMEWCMDELPPKDGKEVMAHIMAVVDAYGEGKQSLGESKDSLMVPTES